MLYSRMQCLIVVLFLIFLSACSAISTTHIPHRSDEAKPKEIYVFLDGTANDAGSRTNVAKLHNLVSLQRSPDIATIYIDGVGTRMGGMFLGLTTGLGNAKRVQEAYRFLAENYNDGDKIYIFGFSRGAWSARILSAMLYVAGLPDLNRLQESARMDAVDDIYYHYKRFWGTIPLVGDDRSLAERRSSVLKYLSEIKLTENHRTNITVDFLGLWDTVQALGVASLDDTNTGEPNDLYGDQLCNIRYIAHAVSLDDYRFEEFTPLLFRQRHLAEERCIIKETEQKSESTIQNANTIMFENVETEIHETWFSGAHSDVGGGYEDTTIDGISLNWMLSKMKRKEIKSAVNIEPVYGNYLDKTHNANIRFLDYIYRDLSRDLSRIYTLQDKNEYNYIYPEKHMRSSLECSKNDTECIKSSNHLNEMKRSVPGEACSENDDADCYEAKIVLHPSVLDRLCYIAPKNFESTWFRDVPFQQCVVCDEEGGRLVEEKDIAGDKNEQKKMREAFDRCNSSLAEDMTDDNYSLRGVSYTANLCPMSDCELMGNSKASVRLIEPVKSCNLNETSKTSHAEVRLNERYVDKNNLKEVSVTYFTDRKDDRTGVMLSAGNTYRISIEHESAMQDCTYDSGLSGRNIWQARRYQGGWFQTLGQNILQMGMRPLNEFSFQNFGAVIGKVGKESIKFYSELENSDGQSFLFTPKKSGELIMTTNEPVGPDFLGYFDNNYGYVTFTIERLDNNG